MCLDFEYVRNRDSRLVTTFCTVYWHVMTVVRSCKIDYSIDQAYSKSLQYRKLMEGKLHDTCAAALKQSGAGLPFSTSSPQLTQAKTDCSSPRPAILAANVARDVLVARATGTLWRCKCHRSLCAPGISLAVCHLQVCDQPQDRIVVLLFPTGPLVEQDSSAV